MEPKSLAATMFDLQVAIDNCERTSNVEWSAKHRIALRNLCKLLPSGSGIDNGTTLVSISTKPERIKLSCSFHHMNDQGSYDGWTEHTVNVRPSFHGLDVSISGPNRNEIKDYLHEVYAHAMGERVHYLDGRWVSVDVQLASGAPRAEMERGS